MSINVNSTNIHNKVCRKFINVNNLVRYIYIEREREREFFR